MGDPVIDCLAPNRVKYLTTAHWMNFNGRVKMMATDSVNLEQQVRWRNYMRLLDRVLEIGTPTCRPEHDVLLFRVLKDDQWAFLVTCHNKFVERTRADIVRGMGDAVVAVTPYLRSETPEAFSDQIRELTHTKEQLAQVRQRVRRRLRNAPRSRSHEWKATTQYDNEDGEMERQDPPPG